MLGSSHSVSKSRTLSSNTREYDGYVCRRDFQGKVWVRGHESFCRWEGAYECCVSPAVRLSLSHVDRAVASELLWGQNFEDSGCERANNHVGIEFADPYIFVVEGLITMLN